MTKTISGIVVVLAMLWPATAIDAQSMFRGDAMHSGTYSGPAPRQFHRVKWKFPTGDRVISSPVFKDNVIYFGGDDGNVYAVDAATGRQIWKRATNGPAPATPAIDGGTVYVGSYDGKFYAFNAQTGALKWKFATDGERRFEAKGLHGMQPKDQTIADPFDIFLSSPVVANGSVYFGSGDGNVYALDSATGDLRWKFKTNDVVHASPALADGVLFFGSWDSYFYAVDAATGKEKWRFHGGEDPVVHNQVGFQSSAAIVDGVVYVGCRDRQRIPEEGGQGLHVFVAGDRGRRRPDRHSEWDAPGARPENRGAALGLPDRDIQAKQRLDPHRRPQIQRPDVLHL